jgi:hypothetical protein
MPDWLNEVIGADLITVYEGQYLTEDAVAWLLVHFVNCARRKSIGCDGWLSTRRIRRCWQSLHRMEISMSACGWRAISWHLNRGPRKTRRRLKPLRAERGGPEQTHTSVKFDKAEPRFRHRGTGADLQEPHRAELLLFRVRYEPDAATLAAAFPSSRLSAS